MIEEYIILAKNFLEIAEGLRKGSIKKTEIPFGNIMQLVAQIYNEQIYNEKEANFFVKLYGTLFKKGLEHNDNEEIAATLSLLARHMMLLSFTDIHIGNGKYYPCCIQYYINCEKVARWHETHHVEEKKHFLGKGVIYSAITGNYDEVKDPDYVNPNMDYVLFTDNPNVTSSVWKVRLIDSIAGLDNTRVARRIKILGHEYLQEYDYSIWVDGKFKIVGDLRDYIEKYSKREPILCYNHHINDCIYQEKDCCQSLQKDKAEIMDAQIKRYQQEGYPEHNGLIESGILVREIHDRSVQKVMKTWWEEVLHGSKRDQLSFNYACWKNDFVYDSSDLYIYDNEYVIDYVHR